MEAKLTLKLDSGAISRAKRYILDHRGKSLSRLVENYFNSLTINKIENRINKTPPIVSELKGIAKRGKVVNLRDDYTNYLIEKYK